MEALLGRRTEICVQKRDLGVGDNFPEFGIVRLDLRRLGSVKKRGEFREAFPADPLRNQEPVPVASCAHFISGFWSQVIIRVRIVNGKIGFDAFVANPERVVPAYGCRGVSGF